MTVGTWLKRRRRQLDLTQKALAHRIGVSVGTIRKIESDERKPSRQLAGLLAEQLDIPMEKRETFIDFVRSETLFDQDPFAALEPGLEDIPTAPTQQGPASPHKPGTPRIKHNLPSQSTKFVGRETDLSRLDDLFIKEGRRLVTVVGPGGMGKTRLALAYARRFVDPQEKDAGENEMPFPDGVFFTALAPLSEPDHIVPAAAAALGLRLRSGGTNRQLIDYLKSKRLLIIFDNFEHLLEGAGLVSEILQNAPDTHILATSRERLLLHDEQVYPIQGLDVPDVDKLEHASGSTSVQLFLQAAQRIQPGFQLPEDLTQVSRICRLVEGMPLGIELAAGWIDMLSLADIAVEIQNSLDFLETDWRDLPSRQRSIRATIDYSWQRLDENEKSVFAQLSIFRGGFTRPAAQDVVGAALRQLSRLFNKSFIQFDPEKERYQVHELMRQYGAEKLAQNAGLWEDLRDRHSSYYCQFLAGLTADLKSAGQRQALVAIHTEFENVRLAWSHAAARQDLDSIGASIEPYFRFFWNRSSHITQGIKDFETAAAMMKQADPGREKSIILGRLLGVLSWLNVFSNPQRAREASRESLAVLEPLDAEKELLMTLLGFVLSHSGEEKTVPILHRALALAKRLGDHWAIGDALLRLGLHFREKGEFERAEKWLQEALRQFEDNQDWAGASWTNSYLSLLLGDQGRYQEALEQARDNLAYTDRIDSPAHIYFALARALFDLNFYEEAEELFQRQVVFLEREGHPHDVPRIHNYLAEIALQKGDLDLAEKKFLENLKYFIHFGDPSLLATTHEALGRVFLARQEKAKALHHILEGLKFGKSIEKRFLLENMVNAAGWLEDTDPGYAVFLAVMIKNQPASHAKVVESVDRLLERINTVLPKQDLENIRRQSRREELDSLSEKLIAHLEAFTP